MNESKTDRFRRVAEARVNKIIKMIRLLGNCSGTGVYEYTDTQAAYIFSALQSELDKAKKRFRKPSLGKHRFSLTDTNEFDDDRPLEPTIALALPDGSYLRAVVYSCSFSCLRRTYKLWPCAGSFRTARGCPPGKGSTHRLFCGSDQRKPTGTSVPAASIGDRYCP